MSLLFFLSNCLRVDRLFSLDSKSRRGFLEMLVIREINILVIKREGSIFKKWYENEKCKVSKNYI